MNEWIKRSFSGFCKLREWEDFGICIWVAFGAMFGQINLSKLQFLPLENGDNRNTYTIRVLRELNEVKSLAWRVAHGKHLVSDVGMVKFIMRNRDDSTFITIWLIIYESFQINEITALQFVGCLHHECFEVTFLKNNTLMQN